MAIKEGVPLKHGRRLHQTPTPLPSVSSAEMVREFNGIYRLTNAELAKLRRGQALALAEPSPKASGARLHALVQAFRAGKY